MTAEKDNTIKSATERQDAHVEMLLTETFPLPKS